MKPTHALLATATAAVLLLAAPETRANDWSNPIDVCQGALPAFESSLRKRPLGIINEGETPVFVNCSMRAPLGQIEGGGIRVNQILLLLTNRAAAAQSVSCTLVDGVAAPFTGFPAIYLPKTVDIQPNNFAVLNWFDFETTVGRFRIPNLSCALPPGAEINIVQMYTAASKA